MSNTGPASQRLGVGIVGCGPVTQAIHLPTLARLTDTFDVVHLMDVDAGIAKSVAARVRARHSTRVEDLLADPDVQVVAICSPHQFHADQVIAACRAGVKAILCEKPLALTAAEADAIAAVSRESGVPVIVGAMHSFDPGWLAAEEAWGAFDEPAHTIRSSILLPPNARFEDFATEVITRPPQPTADFTDPAVVQAMMRGGVMGLAIHDLPLVRRFVPHFSDLKVLRAEIVKPSGYAISAVSGHQTIELHAAMTETWFPQWTLEAISSVAALRITFTPSYVHAGSAVAVLRTRGESRTFGPFDANGYENEWVHLAGLARGEIETSSVDALSDDLQFALAIAEKATTLLEVGE